MNVRWAAAIAGITLITGLGLLGLVGLTCPKHLERYERLENPDAQHYVLLGENFWLRGVYSRQTEPPYSPDVLRTPIYPLLVGGLSTLTGAIWPVYVVQVMLLAGTAVFAMKLGHLMFGAPAGVLAGIVVAADPMSAIQNLQPMSEPLFTFLATVATASFVGLICSIERPRASLITCAWIGALLGLATLTRPAGLYLTPIMGILVLATRSVPWSRRILHALVLVVCSIVVVLPWVARNSAVFGVPRLTTADAINLVYFSGAGAYQVEHRISREEAARRIQRDFKLPALNVVNNHWTVSTPVRDLDRQMRDAAWPVLALYPESWVIATSIGIAKSLVSHNTDVLAHALCRTWASIGLTRLLEGRTVATFSNLWNNGLLLSFIYVLNLLVPTGVFCLALFGLLMVAGGPPSRITGAVLVIGTYHVATIAVVGIDAYSRHRSALVPILAVFAAHGMVVISLAGPVRPVWLKAALSWLRHFMRPRRSDYRHSISNTTPTIVRASAPPTAARRSTRVRCGTNAVGFPKSGSTSAGGSAGAAAFD
jgi:4-amino-4-deoxy-L-arabinose transferase-like glycosyltransferase